MLRRRAIRVVPCLVLLAACATTGGPPTGGRGTYAANDSAKVWVLKERACCPTPAATAVRELIRRLTDEHGLAVSTERPRRTPQESTERNGREVRQVIRRALSLYVSLNVQRLRRELESAQTLVERNLAEGVTARELAELQLLLGALAHAEGDLERARRHFRAAIAHRQDLTPDPDTFSPAIRSELSRVRESQRRFEVTVRSVPAGAEVLLDGERRGGTPRALRVAVGGEHYLRLEAPLYRPWADRVRFSSAAQLEIRLEPRSPEELLAIAQLQPERRAEVATLLGGAGLLVLRAEGETVVVEAMPAGGAAAGRAALTLGTPAPQVAQHARELAEVLRRSRAAGPRKAETDKPGFLRRTWWIWAAAVGVLVPVAIAVPLAVGGETNAPGGSDRPVRLKLP